MTNLTAVQDGVDVVSSSSKPSIETIKTSCPYCGVGCGIVAEVDRAQRRIVVTGDKEHPANWGRLCSKGSALAETVGVDERARYPQLHGLRASWDHALDYVANKLSAITREHGKDAVMFYVSGQLLTEDYYVANKLMKGFIGSNNIDSNSRLCMSSAVAGYKRAFGSDTVPNSYQDIEDSELFVITGSNMAWCHPVLFQRLKVSKEQSAHSKKIVVIDPRRTDSCAIADLHLPIKSGTDTSLFNGLLRYLQTQGGADHQYLPFVDGVEQALAAAQDYDIARVAQVCGVAAQSIEDFYKLFKNTSKVVTLFSMGVNQSSSGTDKANAIINCHLYSGKIGFAGAGPFSITGQPNAMGGREVGALANLLAAHYDLNNPQHRRQVAEFWNVATLAQVPGVTATRAAQAILDGKIKAIWIMATNPVVSLPEAQLMRDALTQCELVVLSDCIANTDTSRYAHVHFPAQGWSEKSGTVTNSDRTMTRQRALLPAFAEAKADWWIISQVAQRMGFDGFNYHTPYEVFKEHAALSVYQNEGQRSFNLGYLQDLTHQQYEDLSPIQWPITKDRPQTQLTVPQRFFGRDALAQKQIYTDTQRAHMIAIHPRAAQSSSSPDYPLVMSTGRIRDQWHTMTRTALAPRLNQHLPEPFVQIHPSDAQHYGVTAGALARVSSVRAVIDVRVYVDDALREGEVFVPMHWNNAYASNACVGNLIAANICPQSSQPELKYTPVNVQPLHVEQYGFILLRQPVEWMHPALCYWAQSRQQHSYRYDLAFSSQLDQTLLQSYFSTLLECDADWIIYADDEQVDYRLVALLAGKLMLAVFLNRDFNKLPSDYWLKTCFERETLDDIERKALLVGQPLDGDFDIGRIVCSCFTVGEKSIRKAIEQQQLKTLEEIAHCLKAGSNCGSCVPEIRALLEGKN